HTHEPVTPYELKAAGDAIPLTTTVVERPVVGSRARADSALGLECTDFEFTGEAETAIPLGRGHRGVAYVLQGRGRIEKEPVEAGMGAVFANIGRLGVHGAPGFRLLLASVPRTDSDESYPE